MLQSIHLNKSLLTAAIILLISVTGISQTLFFENFDTLSAETQLVEQAGNSWTTWNIIPGSYEDPHIIYDTILTDSNSVFITDSNDLVLLLEDKVSGKYRIDFDMLIHSDSAGYFSVLQDFTGNTSQTGLQVFFNSTGTAIVDAEGTNTVSFSFGFNRWHHLQLFVDLDADFASFFFNNNNLISWEWSSGAFNNSGLKKLDALNFYGWNQQDTAGYFVDNVEFTMLANMNAPQNLSISTSSDTAYLHWQAPDGDSLTHYKIYRNENLLDQEITDTFFVDGKLHPKTYTYKVMAYYDDYGYSSLSNSVTDTVFGGVDRNYVLFETGTGIWNEYAQGTSQGLNDMMDSGKQVAIINYHYLDEYQNVFSEDRIDYYEINGFPTTIANGTEWYYGGNSSQGLYADFNTIYSALIAVPSLYTIQINNASQVDTTITFTVEVVEAYPFFTDNILLHAAVVRSGITENWFNQNVLNAQCYTMIPDANGTLLDFTNDTTYAYPAFQMDSAAEANFDDLRLIVFMQNETTKEVLQVETFDFTNIKEPTHIRQKEDIAMNFYPNPAKDFITLNTLENGQLTVYTLTGKSVLTKSIYQQTERINITELENGIYILEFNTSQNKIAKKLVIHKQ